MSALRAIIADDSAFYREVLERALARVGSVEIVAKVCNGAEAVAEVKALTPDLLTLDINMPVMDGLATLRALQAARLDCKVIIIRGHGRVRLRPCRRARA